jgi:NADP-dependent 3-hydroxy acid dehydrogenase YdfG
MKKIAVITGAGSGVGRAVTLRLAREGWSIALTGRNQAPLDNTIRAAGVCEGKLLPFVCDVANRESVAKMAREVQDQLGAASVLVNSAGTNVPNRALDVLSIEDFESMISTNLNGAFYCIHAFLPGMISAKNGTIVNIISDAAIQANAKAGGGYAASKFGLRGLTQAINYEQRGNGIRACALCPGDIDTPLLERRPNPPTPEARRVMLQPDDVAECVMMAINLPHRVVIEELLIRPR